MDEKMEQTANIKFCVKLGKSGAETFEMIRRAYGNEAMCRLLPLPEDEAEAKGSPI
jgi:hypothetical protein